jgi:glycosyltransferase involved in cell wall biosynthesis
LSYSHPIIGFSGSIYDWKVDINLIINLLKELPNCSFVFTGTVKIKNKLLNRKLFSFLNFHHLGILPINKLQQVMSQFDVCLIPYKINKWSQSAYPVKIMEYLALGKPVVVTNLSSIDYLAKNKIIYRASNELSFINLIKKALNEKFNKNTYKNRIDEAIKNDWKNRIIELINMIENDK